MLISGPGSSLDWVGLGDVGNGAASPGDINSGLIGRIVEKLSLDHKEVMWCVEVFHTLVGCVGGLILGCADGGFTVSVLGLKYLVITFPVVGGGGGGEGALLALLKVGNLGLCLTAMLAFTHSLNPFLNFLRSTSHLRDSSNLLIRDTPLFINPSFVIDSEMLGWLTLPLLPLNFVLSFLTFIRSAK